MANSLFDKSMKYLNQGDTVKGLSTLRRAVARDPNNPEAWYTLATLESSPYWRRQCLQRTVALDPYNHKAADELRSIEVHTLPEFQIPVKFKKFVPAMHTRRKYVIFWFAVGLLMLIIAFFSWNSYERKFALHERYLSAGAITQGVVVNKWVRSSDDDDDYYVSYAFRARMSHGDTETLENKMEVNRSFYKSIAEGQNVDVLYIVDDPTISVLNDAYYRPTSTTAVMFFIVGVVAIVVGAISGLRVLMLTKRLKSEGVNTQAIVVGRWQDTDSDGDSVYRLVYEFVAQRLDDQKCLIHNLEGSKDIFINYPLEAVLDVRYLPSNPKIYEAPI